MNSKIYRCGHCGQPVGKNAKPLEGESFERVCRILDEYGDHRTHKNTENVVLMKKNHGWSKLRGTWLPMQAIQT
jgi:CRISPR/Cas system-associated protein Cas10 (large subunit of type III CRISPR-Cas system)